MDNIQNEINTCSLCGNLPKLTEKSLKIGTTPLSLLEKVLQRMAGSYQNKRFIILKGNYKQAEEFWKDY